MLVVCLKDVHGVALVRSMLEMLELEISRGLEELERGAYHGARIMLCHPMFAAAKCHDEQTEHWMLRAPRHDPAVGGWPTSVCC